MKKKKGKCFLDKCKLYKGIKKNPWMASTILLLALVIIFVSLGFIQTHASSKSVGEDFVKYINSQGEVNVSYLSSSSFSPSLYEVNVELQGQKVPVYITKDGKYFVQLVMPLKDETKPKPQPAPEQTQTNIPKSDKPKVELFVMSYCPFGTQEEKGIIPALEALNNSIDFKLRFVYYAMHPTQGEVQENLLQYCVQETQPEKLLPYLKCFLEDANNTRCLEATNIDTTSLNTCISQTDKEYNITKNLDDKSSWLNGNYPLFNIDKDLNTKYGVQGSPTLVINGVQASSARDPESFLKTICSAFNNAPEACNTQLSTTSYSAGFGYNVASSGSTAQCG